MENMAKMEDQESKWFKERIRRRFIQNNRLLSRISNVDYSSGLTNVASKKPIMSSILSRTD
jgi:hypothetical protein